MQLNLSLSEAAVLEYALGTALDNERDKGEEGLGGEWLERINIRWGLLREAISQGKQDIRLDLDLISAGVALQYLVAVEGSADSVELAGQPLDVDVFETGRCAILEALARWEGASSEVEALNGGEVDPAKTGIPRAGSWR
jgi:hypothetical protein